MGQAAVRVGSGELDRPPEQVYHTLQHALKMAFYQAGTALLGGEPPWGALTGVRPVKLPTRAMLAGATEAQACRELEREYHVSPRRARLAVECARASLAAVSYTHLDVYKRQESAETTSPPWRRASSTARRVLPEAVGPEMTRIFGGMGDSFQRAQGPV